MKSIRQIAAFVSAVTFLMSSVPVSAYADNDTTASDSAISETSDADRIIELKDEVFDIVTVSDKKYDGTTKAEVDCSRLNDWIYDQYALEVNFTAEGVFAQKNAANSVSVTVSTFEVSGKDSGKVSFNSGLSINKQANIKKNEFIVIPEITSCYYGQKLPDSVALKWKDKVPSGVKLPADLEIEKRSVDEYGFSPIGTYNFKSQQYTDNNNYVIKLADNSVFTVEEYDPSEAAVPENEDNTYNNRKSTLSAPDGFLISDDKKDFKDSIDIKLYETSGSSMNSTDYYLKNNSNSTDKDAVSKKKSYKYYCVSSKPTISSVTASSSNSVLKPQKTGIVSDKNITLHIEGTASYLSKDELQVNIYEEGGTTPIATVPVSDAKNSTFTAEYTLELPKDAECEDFQLEIAVENNLGEGTRVKAVSDGNAANHIIIDTSAPSAPEENITIRYVNDPVFGGGGCLVAEGIITDTGSGIKSIKYRFDNQKDKLEYDFEKNEAVQNYYDKTFFLGASAWNELDKSSVAKKKDFSKDFSNKNTDPQKVYFRILVPYSSTELTYDNLHTLYLDITDFADHTTSVNGKYQKKDSGGVDTFPPVITKFDIDGKLNVLPSGNYANKPVNFIVKGKDESNSEDYISGLRSFRITDENNTNNEILVNDEDEEYPISVRSVYAAEHVKIEAYDKGNQLYSNSISAEIKKMFKNSDPDLLPDPSLKNMTSDALIIENTAPKAKFDLSQNSAKYSVDGEDIYWFNSDDQNVQVKYTDELSGINNTSLKGNGPVPEKKDFSTKKDRVKEDNDTLSMADFKDDEYIYSAYVQDNSGNANTDSISKKTASDDTDSTAEESKKTENNTTQKFYVDKTAPSGSVHTSTKSGVRKIKDCDWVSAEENFSIYILGADNFSGIQKIDVKVNGKTVDLNKENFYDFSDGMIKERQIVFTKSDLDKQGISMNDDHTYKVEYSVTDFANNSSKDYSYTLHVDTENPKIDTVCINSLNSGADGKHENTPGGIINFLKIGIFSNTSISFKVDTSDVKFDSGINTLLVQLVDKDNTIKNIPIEPVKDGDSFSFEIPLESGFSLSKMMKLTVTDNYGKTCSYFGRVVNTVNGLEFKEIPTEIQEDEDGNSFLDIIIEDIAPDMALDLPKPDYTDKDGRLWFSNDTRNIQLTVSDNESGLNNVDIKVNDASISQDSLEQEILNPESVESILNNAFVYTLNTDKPNSNAESKPENGEYVIKFSAADNAGNISEKASTEDGKELSEYRYFIDDTIPEIQSVSFEPVSSNGKENNSEFKDEPEIFEIDSLNYGYFFKTDCVLKVYPFDENPSSGLKCVNYKLISYDDITQPEIIAEDMAEIGEDGYAEIKIEKGFKGRIVMSAEDNVGNRSADKYMDALISEDTAPDLSIDISANSTLHDAEGNELFTEDVTAKVTVSDLKSGISKCSVEINSEKSGDSLKNEIIDIEELINAGGSLNGWVIEQTEANLVTKISKEFTFSQDDNNIVIRAKAEDNCGNENAEPVSSKTFTIDKTAPVIDVSYNGGYNDSNFYNSNNKAVITLDITERNFDADLIDAAIDNSFNSNRPQISYSSSAADKHKLVLTFGEGDYTFSVKGRDLADHEAETRMPNEGMFRFNVDETAPAVSANFEAFSQKDADDNFFNTKQKVTLTIKEHNFSQNLVNLQVLTKAAGSAHDSTELYDTTGSFVKYSDWKTSAADPDLHTLEFYIDKDAVYKLVVAPSDKAGNAAGSMETKVFEIDMTKPVVSAKNGQSVKGKENEVEFLDVYNYLRTDNEVPSIEFDDVNFDHLKYTLVKYVPDLKKNGELSTIVSDSKEGTVNDKKFVLDDFDKDGTYFLEIEAYDKAGNASVLNKNTYVHMKEKDVLAYIPDSNIEKSSGLFSLEYENGDAISKRPEDFDDIEIVVMARDKSDVKIVLRDMNGDEKDTMLTPEDEKESMYGMSIYTYKLRSEFFINNYQSDTDAELNLSVINNDERLDLGKIHIDNIAPTGNVDKKFKSWHWYPGNKEKTIVVSDISERLNAAECKVFDNSKEIPFEYSQADKTFTFKLGNGWHNVGVHIEDEAGNVFDIQQADNICVGNFWLWVIIGGVVVSGGAAAAFIILKKRKN